MRIGVIGGGLMGSGIAESAARAGVTVTLYEPDDAPICADDEVAFFPPVTGG